MLILSDRLRADDIARWNEMADADQIHGQCLIRSGKIERSIIAIERFLAIGPAYVGVSWGKDSVVAAHLVQRTRDSIPLINLRCSNRNPDCDAVRDSYLSHLPAGPAGDYREVDVDYADLHARGFPHQDLDRMTDERWYRAIRESGESFAGRHILGIRADESNGRRFRCHCWGHNSPNGCAPLAWWTTADVFAYLAINKLPVHPAYAMLGGGRWQRERLRVAEIGDTHGTGGGRLEWEREYYGDVLNRLAQPRG